MGFFDKIVQGVNKIANDATVKTKTEVKKAASETANQLGENKTPSEPKAEKKTQVVRPNSITKSRLEKSDKKSDKGTISLAEKQQRANDTAHDLMDKVAREQQEKKDAVASEEDLMPEVKIKDDEQIDEYYDFLQSIKPKGRAANFRAHLSDDETAGERRERQIEEQRLEAKAEAAEKRYEASKPRSVVVVENEPDYSWDDDAGMFVDNRKKKTTEDPISYEEDLARRSAAGEDMMAPEKGAYIDAGDGRVYDGKTVNEYGDNVLLSHFITGDFSKGHAAAGYDEDDIAPVLTDIVNGISGGVSTIESSIRNLRMNNAEENADWRFRTSDGNLYDFDDMRDSVATDEFSEYFDNYLASPRGITREKPENARTTDRMYSGGSWYAAMRDAEGNVVYDENGDPKMVKVGTFDGTSDFDDEGNPIVPGSFDEETGMWMLPSGVLVDARIDDDLNIFPNVTYNWDIETDDADKAIAWNEPYESFTTNGKREVPIADILEMVQGGADRENHNNSFHTAVGIEIPDVLGLNKTAEELSIQNEDGNIDPIKFAQNFAPMAVDGALSTVPFLNPYSGAVVTGNNLMQASRGLDPYTFDSRTGTFEAPGTMSEDQYRGKVMSVASETMLDSLFGLGKLGLGAGVSKGPRKLLPQTEERVARAAVRENKKMSRSMPRRAVGMAVEEGLTEVAPEFVTPLERGDYWNTYFASQKEDDEGNLVWDEAGNPVYDTETPFGDRTVNALNAAIPSGILGAALGVGIGGPGSYGQYKRDKAVLAARDGFVPVNRDNMGTSAPLTDEERNKANDWFRRQQEVSGNGQD